MKVSSLAVPAVALALLGVPGLAGRPAYAAPAPQISIHLGWDQPPNEYRDVQRQGFHAGIDAARNDFQAGRPPNPNRHWEFRNPHVPPPDRHDYREAFREGYFRAMHHMHDQGGPH